jgi:hypothetical protein
MRFVFTDKPVLMPRQVHDIARARDIFIAILGYRTYGEEVPKEWEDELQELVEKYGEGILK